MPIRLLEVQTNSSTVRFRILIALSLTLLAVETNAQKRLSDIEQAKVQFTYAFDEIAKSKARDPKVISPRSVREDTLFIVPSRDWTSGCMPLQCAIAKQVIKRF